MLPDHPDMCPCIQCTYARANLLKSTRVPQQFDSPVIATAPTGPVFVTGGSTYEPAHPDLCPCHVCEEAELTKQLRLELSNAHMELTRVKAELNQAIYERDRNAFERDRSREQHDELLRRIDRERNPS